MATLYFAVFPAATTPTWSRGTGTDGWSGTPTMYGQQASAPAAPQTNYDPTITWTGSLAAGTSYKLWAVWDDGTNTSNLLGSSAFTSGTETLVGRSDETDAALALAALQVRPTGLSTEANAALTLSPLQITATGIASETDAALALSSGSAAQVGLASETDAALALSPLQITAIGPALETDSALALEAGSPGAVGVAGETNTALALSAVQISQVGMAAETAAALSLAAVQAITAGMALEIDAGVTLSALQIKSVGVAVETDIAMALASGGSGACATAADVWGYVMSNGETAEANVVAIRALLEGLTSTSIADAVWAKVLP